MGFDGSRLEYYRSRAKLVREMADRCKTPQLKAEYERIAEQYDQLAREAEGGTLAR